MKTTTILVALGILVTRGAISPAAAANPCGAAKLDASGKLTSCLLALESRQAKQGDPIDPAKVAKCVAKFSRAFAKAESRYLCVATGDRDEIEDKIDMAVGDIDAALSVAIPNRCQSLKLKASGRRAKCLLALVARKASTGDPVDPLRRDRCITQFNLAFAKAETGPPCPTPGDAGAIGNKVDMLRDDLERELDPPPTTSTTVPTTSTSTTVVTTTSTTTATAMTSTTLCSCCPSGTSVLRFTTGTPLIGGGGCGNVEDSGNAVLFNIDCGGLYTGGGGTTLPLPNVVPDTGASYMKTTGCVGSSYNLAPTVPGDHPAAPGPVTIRNCTSAGVPNPIYPACDTGTRAGLPCVVNADCPPTGTCGGGGASMSGCLFGPPHPLPNSTYVAFSVCVINRVVTSASGSGSCSLGTINLSLPLAADLYLTGDLLDGSALDRPAVPGIQPCPICDGTLLCKGGPRHGLACTPGNSTGLGAAYPTSHDCPPPLGGLGSTYIGALAFPFNLTTDPTGTLAASHKVATFQNGQERFCGFCSNLAGTVWKNPPVACTSNANCAGITGCPGTAACGTCKQRTSGAFGTASAGPGAEHEITLLGSPAGVCLADGAPHAATLVSAFCIPPAFNATVDANWDLPGPGATALIGTSQIFP